MNWNKGLFVAQPLFSCANEVELEDGVDDLKVTCRIVSVRAALEIIKVRVFGEHGKNFTIAPALYDSDEPTETAYSNDNRYVVRIVRHQATVRIGLYIPAFYH